MKRRRIEAGANAHNTHAHLHPINQPRAGLFPDAISVQEQLPDHLAYRNPEITGSDQRETFRIPVCRMNDLAPLVARENEMRLSRERRMPNILLASSSPTLLRGADHIRVSELFSFPYGGEP